jgi:hypothetical protein
LTEAQPIIKTDKLTGQYLKRFGKISAQVAKSYDLALQALIDPTILSYVPVVRVTPFVVVKLRKMEVGLVRQTYYGLTYVDSDDFGRFAIYPSLDVLEKFPHYASAIFGHELAHIIDLGGKPKATREELVGLAVAPLKEEQRREARADRALSNFTPEFQPLVKEWDGVSKNADSKQFLVEKAWTVTGEQFRSFMFSKDKKKKLDEVLKSEIIKVLEL